MTSGMIGLGNVGLALAAAFADTGGTLMRLDTRGIEHVALAQAAPTVDRRGVTPETTAARMASTHPRRT